MIELEHIGIAVSELRDALRVFADVAGVTPYKVETVEPDGVRTYFLRGGGAKLELLEALKPESPIRKHLERRGAGLHHLAFEVDDLEAVLNRLISSGYEPVDREPRAGADGKRIAFLHPKQTAGVLIELCENVGSILRERDVESGGRTLQLREAGLEENPPCLLAGLGELAEDVARLLEQECRIVAWEDPETSVLDVMETLGLEKPHVVARGPFVESALEAAAASLSAVSDGVRVESGLRANCPALVLGFDDSVEGALALHGTIGGALAILPKNQPRIAGVLLREHIRSAQRPK